MDEEALWGLIDAFEAALAEGDLDAARNAWEAASRLAGPKHPEVAYAEARLVREEDGEEAATPLFERVIELDDTHADAHHDLALAAESRGDLDAMIAHFQRVRVLDAKRDRDVGLGNAHQLAHIEKVAHEVLAGLPPPWPERLADVPIVLERHPSKDVVAEGFDPRSIGLFEGRTHGDESTPAPSRIVLYTCNLLAEFPDEPELSQEIEITLLHEIGHFFGLDEDDMQRLGLD
jgi:predicted Zn-dependent protease with MMP-like domain